MGREKSHQCRPLDWPYSRLSRVFPFAYICTPSLRSLLPCDRASVHQICAISPPKSYDNSPRSACHKVRTNLQLIVFFIKKKVRFLFRIRSFRVSALSEERRSIPSFFSASPARKESIARETPNTVISNSPGDTHPTRVNEEHRGLLLFSFC